MLAEKGITIPDDDREGNEEEAPLYGCTYFDLEDKISTLLAPYVDTNNGYYFIDGNLLYFWDSAVQEGTVVCSAPNCDHQGSYCNAYIGSYGDENQYGFVKTGMEIYNDHIYMLGYEMGDVMDFYIEHQKRIKTPPSRMFESYYSID